MWKHLWSFHPPPPFLLSSTSSTFSRSSPEQTIVQTAARGGKAVVVTSAYEGQPSQTGLFPKAPFPQTSSHFPFPSRPFHAARSSGSPRPVSSSSSQWKLHPSPTEGGAVPSDPSPALQTSTSAFSKVSCCGSSARWGTGKWGGGLWVSPSDWAPYLASSASGWSGHTCPIPNAQNPQKNHSSERRAERKTRAEALAS